MTDYSSAYEEVVDTVMEYTKSLSDATFLLSYDNTDTDVYQHIHIRDGEREVLGGHIVKVEIEFISGRELRAYLEEDL